MRLPGNGMSWKEFGKGVSGEISRDNVTDLAATVTYYGVLALFPFVLFLVALASLFITPADAEKIVSQLAAVAPGAATRIIGDRIEQLTGVIEGLGSCAETRKEQPGGRAHREVAFEDFAELRPERHDAVRLPGLQAPPTVRPERDRVPVERYVLHFEPQHFRLPADEVETAANDVTPQTRPGANRNHGWNIIGVQLRSDFAFARANSSALRANVCEPSCPVST